MEGRSRRFDKDALFRDLGYVPHPGQLRVHRSTARHRVLACGTRWGKSTCASAEAVVALLQPCERSLGWLVAPTYDLAQRILRGVTETVVTKLNHHVREIDTRHQRIVLTNLAGGVSELRGKSADQPVGLLGEALDFLIVDEAAKLRREVWDEMLSARLIDRNGWSLLLSTPAGPGWFHDAFRRGQRNRDPECESWGSPSSDNPHIRPEIIEAERARLSEDVFAQQFEAKFLNVPQEICEACGGPREDVSGKVTAPVGQYHFQPPSCPSCGMFVDETGRCIVKKCNVWHAEFDVDYPWSDPVGGEWYTWGTVTGDGVSWFQY